MAKPNFILPNKPAIKAGSILSYNYTDDLTFAAEPLDFSRNSSATRVNEQGLIEEVGYFGPQLVQNGDFSQEGPELITNGDFATDSDWTKGTGWSISGGTANCDGTQTGNTSLTQFGAFTTLANKSIKISFTVSNYSAGSVRFISGNGALAGAFVSANGVVTLYFNVGANSGTSFNIQGNADFVGSIDNVSVKEVGQDWILSSEVTIQNNSAAFTLAPSGQQASQAISSVIGKKYKIIYEIKSITQGAFDVSIGGSLSASYNNSVGVYTEYLTATTTSGFYVRSRGTTSGSITNVSVIEIIGDKPRIDYSDSSTEPSLLLEPQSTNLIEYSENFSEWEKRGDTTISATNIISPSGHSNATNITGLNGSGGNDLRFYPPGFNSASKTLCFSVYLKGSGTLRLQMSNGVDQGIQQYITLTDNWKRYQALGNFNSTSSVGFHCNIDDLDGQTATQYDVWGAQLEQLSYPTSYIPTSGSTATRLGETANNAGGAGVFNSEEGVLYAEIAALANDLTIREIALSDGTANNRIELRFTNNPNEIQVVVRAIDGAVQHARQTSAYTITSFNKIAFKYKLNDFAFWINGVEIATGTGGVTPIGLSELAFDAGDGYSDFYGKTKNIQVFNYALTDEELQTLTT